MRVPTFDISADWPKNAKFSARKHCHTHYTNIRNESTLYHFRVQIAKKKKKKLVLAKCALNRALLAATLNDNHECIGNLIKMGAKNIDECIRLAEVHGACSEGHGHAFAHEGRFERMTKV